MNDWKTRQVQNEQELQRKVDLLEAGDRRALAQTISFIESTHRDKRLFGEQILHRLQQVQGKKKVSFRLGISGIAGAGKSTLINALGALIVSKGLRLAVLTVDPSSALKGGSLLGDATRMADIVNHPQVFVRSTPSGQETGGVAKATAQVIQLCEVAGYDVIIVESLGSGQVEFELSHSVDVLFWLTTPGAGDDLQAMKQGILEWADGIVITQADRGREGIALESQQAYEQGFGVTMTKMPVLVVSAFNAQQVAEFWRHVQVLLEKAIGWSFNSSINSMPGSAKDQLLTLRQERSQRKLVSGVEVAESWHDTMEGFCAFVQWLEQKLTFDYDWVGDFLPKFVKMFGLDAAQFNWNGACHLHGKGLSLEETSRLSLLLPVELYCSAREQELWHEHALPIDSVIFIPLSVISNDVLGGGYASISNSDFRFLLGYRFCQHDIRHVSPVAQRQCVLLMQWSRAVKCVFFEAELQALQHVIRPKPVSDVDELTGLANRDSFCRHLDDVLIRMQQTEAFLGRAVYVYGIDLDDFRRVNEVLGLEVGDQLLCLVAEVLVSLLEIDDLVARFGGDEFFLCKSFQFQAGEDPVSFAQAFGDRLTRSLNEAVSLRMKSVARVHCHIGCVPLVSHKESHRPLTLSTNEVLRAAGAALFSAKSLGQEGVLMYDPGLRQRAQRHFATKNELLQAMAEDQFTYLAQPLVNQKNKQIIGAELLLRWQHPKRGILAASEFIESATGLGILQENDLRLIFKDLDRIVLIAKTYNVIFHLNLSAQLFFDEEIIDFVIALEKHGALPYLHFEITEHAFVHRLVVLHQFIYRVRAGGSQVWLDDFGVGYSGLRYLDALELDGIKIDQSFIRRLDQPRTRTLLRGIMHLLSELNLSVLAEGVERQEQADFLVGLGCEQQQGLLHGTALPLDEFVDLVKGNNQSV